SPSPLPHIPVLRGTYASLLQTTPCRAQQLLSEGEDDHGESNREHRIGSAFALAEADALALRLHEVAHVLRLVVRAALHFLGVHPMVRTRIVVRGLGAPQQEAAVHA